MSAFDFDPKRHQADPRAVDSAYKAAYSSSRRLSVRQVSPRGSWKHARLLNSTIL
jgi:hypothetical protein